MGALDKNLRDRLIAALVRVPAAEDQAGRTALLGSIPRHGLNRHNNAFVDLQGLVQQFDGLGRLDNGERPIAILTHNAAQTVLGSDLGRELQALEREVEEAYSEEAPLDELPTIPEALPFGGSGEWVTDTFLDQARRAGASVARLLVPRVEGNTRRSFGSVGTGWLVAPGLLLTNHHVIRARKNEPAPSAADFRKQAEETIAWFDYNVEGQQPPDVRVSKLESSNPGLDYALLRLADSPSLTKRQFLAVPQAKTQLDRGTRLNVVQCPGGGPLRFAIRNNFYVGAGDRAYQVRYLTDTIQGSSGSPVLDDDWQVVALHHGATKISPAAYPKEPGTDGVAKYHNQGIAIHDILADLPPAILTEIGEAQAWAVAQ